MFINTIKTESLGNYHCIRFFKPFGYVLKQLIHLHLHMSFRFVAGLVHIIKKVVLCLHLGTEEVYFFSLSVKVLLVGKLIMPYHLSKLSECSVNLLLPHWDSDWWNFSLLYPLGQLRNHFQQILSINLLKPFQKVIKFFFYSECFFQCLFSLAASAFVEIMHDFPHFYFD